MDEMDETDLTEDQALIVKLIGILRGKNKATREVIIATVNGCYKTRNFEPKEEDCGEGDLKKNQCRVIRFQTVNAFHETRTVESEEEDCGEGKLVKNNAAQTLHSVPADVWEHPVCARCSNEHGPLVLDYGRMADGVIVSRCRCGGGSVAITARAWKRMRRREKKETGC